jgi:cystathionine gamma-lyase
MKFATKVIHAGIEPDPTTGAIMTPIYQTSTYAQDGPGNHKGYEYARTKNPTRSVLEANIAALENGKFGICFSSGVAATAAVIQMLSPGDEILSTNDLYGGTYRLFARIFEKFGITVKYVDMTEANNVAENISAKTRLIWIETPTNPMLNLVDIQAVCTIAKEHGLRTCVDNTFASPYLQTPLDLGADIVVHSGTKYLNGHSDVIHGVVVCRDEKIAEELYFIQKSVGAVPGPQDCFLVLRGIKTLHLRVERACQNAAEIANFLQSHPLVDKVYYPGFATHKGHEIAKKQMRGFGGMVSFTLKDDTFTAAQKVLQKTEYFTCAESLGGVESLIGHPATMTHAAIPRELRLAVGITDSFMRLSVGVEDISDLIEDLSQALQS